MGAFASAQVTAATLKSAVHRRVVEQVLALLREGTAAAEAGEAGV